MNSKIKSVKHDTQSVNFVRICTRSTKKKPVLLKFERFNSFYL